MYLNGIQIQGISNGDLIKVNGLESAKLYPNTQPNSRIALFDENDDIFYVVTTDASNYKSSIKRYRFYEESIEDANDAKYVTKEEFNGLKEMITGVQQSVQQFIAKQSEYIGSDGVCG